MFLKIFQVSTDKVNKVNLSSFHLKTFFKLICACVISARKAKHLDVTTMFTYSHANTPLGQSEHAYYLSYFININGANFTYIYDQSMHMFCLQLCTKNYNDYLNFF